MARPSAGPPLSNIYNKIDNMEKIKRKRPYCVMRKEPAREYLTSDELTFSPDVVYLQKFPEAKARKLARKFQAIAVPVVPAQRY